MKLNGAGAAHPAPLASTHYGNFFLIPACFPRRIRSGNKSLSRAAAQTMLVEAAGAFAGAVKAGNDLAIHIHHLALRVNAQARARIMHVRRAQAA